MGFLSKIPQAIGGALIGGAFNVGAGALQAKAANRAADLQSQSTREALMFEREKEAQRRADYTRALAIWTAGRQALAQRYGIDLGAIGPAEPFTPTSPTPQTPQPARPRDISELIQPRRYGPGAGPQGV